MTEKTSPPAATGMQEAALSREARREALVFVATYADEIAQGTAASLDCDLTLTITPRHRRALWTIAETLRAKARPKIIDEKGAAKP